jgi:hypothetical protein
MFDGTSGQSNSWLRALNHGLYRYVLALVFVLVIMSHKMGTVGFADLLMMSLPANSLVCIDAVDLNLVKSLRSPARPLF